MRSCNRKGAYYVVNYLVQNLCRQFSRQLCRQLSRHLVMSLQGLRTKQSKKKSFRNYNPSEYRPVGLPLFVKNT